MSTTITLEPAAPSKSVSEWTSHAVDGRQHGGHIELQDLEAASAASKTSPSSPQDAVQEAPDTPPANAISAKQRWNTPRINLYRVAVANLSLLNLGLNDASFGVRRFPSKQRAFC